MSGLDLDAIHQRAEAATDGPWQVEDNDGCPPEIWGEVDTMEMIFGDSADGYMIKSRDDLLFIAAARTDIPTLLAEVERLRTENAEQARLLEYLDGAVAQSLDMVDEVERLRGIITEARSLYEKWGHGGVSLGLHDVDAILKRAEVPE